MQAITVCDEKINGSGLYHWKRGRRVPVGDFDGFVMQFLEMTDKSGARGIGFDTSINAGTERRGVMLGFKGEKTDKTCDVKGQDGLEILCLGVDLDKGAVPPLSWFHDHCPYQNLAHESTNATPEQPKLHVFVATSRPLRTKEEVKLCLRHLDEVLPEPCVTVSANNLNRVWSCLQDGRRYLYRREGGVIDVDKLVAEAGTAAEPPRQEELERPVTSSDEGTLRHVAECLLERARVEIMRLEDGERHQRLLPILGWLSADLHYLFANGLSDDPEHWRQRIAAILDELLATYEVDPHDAQSVADHEERLRDTPQVLRDQWQWGSDNPRIVEMPTLVTDEGDDIGSSMLDQAEQSEETITVPPFPLDLLPPELKEASEAVNYVVDAPMETCAHAVLAAATMSVQHLRDVRINRNWKFPINNFFLILGSSGVRKSAVLNVVQSPLETYMDELWEAYEVAMHDYSIAHDTWTKKEKEFKRLDNDALREQKLKDLGPEPKPPVTAEIWHNDITIPALMEVLRMSPASSTWTLDEAGTYFGGYSAKKDNSEHSSSALNGLWNGRKIGVVRKTDGEKGTKRKPQKPLNGRRMTLLWFCQPDIATDFVTNDALKKIGLLPRILLTYAAQDYVRSPRREYDHPEEYTRAEHRVDAFQRLLLDRMRQPGSYKEDVPNELDPDEMTLSKDALPFYIDEQERLSPLKLPEGRYAGVAEFAEKLMEHALRMAATFTLFENPHAREIELPTLKKAVELAHYYAETWLAISKIPDTDPTGSLMTKFRQWLLNGSFEQVSRGFIATHGPLQKRDPALQDRLFQAAIDEGLLEKVYERSERHRLRDSSRHVGSHRVVRPKKRRKSANSEG